MKRASIFLAVIFIFLQFSYIKSDIIYLDPVPNSNFVNTNTNLIVGINELIDANTITEFRIEITGSKSGLHPGTMKLTSDGKKIIFKPGTPFSLGERIDVVIGSGLTTIYGTPIAGRSYSFYTQNMKIIPDAFNNLASEFNNFKVPPGKTDSDNDDPPVITITIFNSPAPGDIFLSSFPNNTSIIITDNQVNPYYYLNMPSNVYDFKEQPNGNLTYFRNDVSKFFEMDVKYTIIDSFSCGNGYTTDLHEMRLLPNGHALLLSYDPEPVDMSKIVQGGDPNAIVTGLIVQEVDDENFVYFQWRSWDHFLITDATHENLTAQHIDYAHGNAIEYDNDGNLLISTRNMDEITKIDISNGNIIWRLGGRNNQFSFIGDPIGFSHQHAIRRIANGHITMFDNGNFHAPQFSRAVEYSLNETSKTVTLVWQFRHTPDILSPAMGYVERLENGNTLIGWGLTATTFTEVKPDGTITLEAHFPAGIYSYRAFKYIWHGEPLAITQISNNTPKSFSLAQNYPNPFNPTTVIEFDVPKASEVELSIFDINGKEMENSVKKQLQPGKYSVTFDGTHFSSGVYFYRIKAGDFMQSKKMILVK